MTNQSRNMSIENKYEHQYHRQLVRPRSHMTEPGASHQYSESCLLVPLSLSQTNNIMFKRKLVSSILYKSRSHLSPRPSSPHQARTNMNFFRSRSSNTSSATLIAFYEGTGGDHRGRRLDDILKWNTRELELSHDYIQTLFPLPEESGVNWSAPTIDRQVFEAFRSRPELREKLRDSLKRILWFYGFELQIGNGKVKVKPILLFW
jgi:hypothetical protein